MEEAGEPKKIDIKALVAIIPPATARREAKRRSRERRVRVRYDESVKRGTARISPSLAKELGITDCLEVVVAGRRRLRLKTIIDEGLTGSDVWCNPEELRERGIADNSIATVRRAPC